MTIHFSFTFRRWALQKFRETWRNFKTRRGERRHRMKESRVAGGLPRRCSWGESKWMVANVLQRIPGWVEFHSTGWRDSSRCRREFLFARNVIFFLNKKNLEKKYFFFWKNLKKYIFSLLSYVFRFRGRAKNGGFLGVENNYFRTEKSTLYSGIFTEPAKLYSI